MFNAAPFSGHNLYLKHPKQVIRHGDFASRVLIVVDSRVEILNLLGRCPTVAAAALSQAESFRSKSPTATGRDSTDSDWIIASFDALVVFFEPRKTAFVKYVKFKV